MGLNSEENQFRRMGVEESEMGKVVKFKKGTSGSCNCILFSL